MHGECMRNAWGMHEESMGNAFGNAFGTTMFTSKILMGTYKILMGTYKMQVMHKFVLVFNNIKICQ
jgi:hypothetical protein